MTLTRFVALGLAVQAAAGCASSLKTIGADGAPVLGIPVASRVLVRVTETTTFVVDPANPAYAAYCTPETSSRYEFMPLGEPFYVVFEPAALGKGEFRLELAESGVLKSVSLNSDATAGADDVGELLAAVLPFVAAPRREPEAAGMVGADDTAQKLKTRYCLKNGTAVTLIERVTIPPAK